jgi:hypothetical protein
MRKLLVVSASVSLLFIQLVLPLIVLADTSNNFLNIVPCGNTYDEQGRERNPNDVANECGLDDFVIMVRNIINAIIIIAIPVTMIVITWIGILLLTAQGDSGKITRAKETLWKVVIGFIVILSAWLVVQIVFMSITGKNFIDFFK